LNGVRRPPPDTLAAHSCAIRNKRVAFPIRVTSGSVARIARLPRLFRAMRPDRLVRRSVRLLGRLYAGRYRDGRRAVLTLNPSLF